LTTTQRNILSLYLQKLPADVPYGILVRAAAADSQPRPPPLRLIALCSVGFQQLTGCGRKTIQAAALAARDSRTAAGLAVACEPLSSGGVEARSMLGA
jgi:hypothetical protein